MNKVVVVGSGLLVLALVAGCGGAGEETVIKDEIELMKQMTAAYDKVTNEKSFKVAEAEVAKLMPKVEELKKKVDSWPEEKQKQVNEKYGAELQAAADRLTVALKSARKKAAGKGEGS